MSVQATSSVRAGLRITRLLTIAALVGAALATMAASAAAAGSGSGSISFALPARYTGRGDPNPHITQYLCGNAALNTNNSAAEEPALGMRGTLAGHSFTALFSATQTAISFENVSSSPAMYGGPAPTFTPGKRVAGTVAVAVRNGSGNPAFGDPLFSGSVTVDLTCSGDVAAGGTGSGAAAPGGNGSGAQGAPTTNAASVPAATPAWPVVPLAVAALAAVGAAVFAFRFFGRKPGVSTVGATSEAYRGAEADSLRRVQEGAEKNPAPSVPEGKVDEGLRIGLRFIPEKYGVHTEREAKIELDRRIALQAESLREMNERRRSNEDNFEDSCAAENYGLAQENYQRLLDDRRLLDGPGFQPEPPKSGPEDGEDPERQEIG